MAMAAQLSMQMVQTSCAAEHPQLGLSFITDGRDGILCSSSSSAPKCAWSTAYMCPAAVHWRKQA